MPLTQPRLLQRYPIVGTAQMMAVGSDNNLWYYASYSVSGTAFSMTRLSATSGAQTNFVWQNQPGCLGCISAGGRMLLASDGNLWFVYTNSTGEPDISEVVASVSPTGQFGQGSFNTLNETFVSDIAKAPVGTVWSVTGRIYCGGYPSCITYGPKLEPASLPVAPIFEGSAGVQLAFGTQGDLWEAQASAPAGLVRVDPVTGKTIHHYKVAAADIVPGKSPFFTVAFVADAQHGVVGEIAEHERFLERRIDEAITSNIAVAADGSIWAGGGRYLVRLAPDGKVSRIAVTLNSEQFVGRVAVGANGVVWCSTRSWNYYHLPLTAENQIIKVVP
jgi:hypothetical protein